MSEKEMTRIRRFLREMPQVMWRGTSTINLQREFINRKIKSRRIISVRGGMFCTSSAISNASKQEL